MQEISTKVCAYIVPCLERAYCKCSFCLRARHADEVNDAKSSEKDNCRGARTYTHTLEARTHTNKKAAFRIQRLSSASLQRDCERRRQKHSLLGAPGTKRALIVAKGSLISIVIFLTPISGRG
jgi:hypothetical protein